MPNSENLSPPETMLPEQMRRGPHWSGAQKLVAACLQDALEQLDKNAPYCRTSVKAYLLYKEAWAWVHDADQSYAFCFVPICQAIGIDPAAALTEIDAKLPPPPKRKPRQRSLLATRRAA